MVLAKTRRLNRPLLRKVAKSKMATGTIDPLRVGQSTLIPRLLIQINESSAKLHNRSSALRIFCSL